MLACSHISDEGAIVRVGSRWFVFGCCAHAAYFTKDHEYIKVDGGTRRAARCSLCSWLSRAEQGIVGITDYAQQQLGDVVYVELPDAGASACMRCACFHLPTLLSPSPGASFKQKGAFGSVESVKASSSVYAPVDITVRAAALVLCCAGRVIERSQLMRRQWLNCPLAAQVVANNKEVLAKNALINESAEDKGWLLKVRAIARAHCSDQSVGAFRC